MMEHYSGLARVGFNQPWVQNRWKWIRGKIAKDLGPLHRAETQCGSTQLDTDFTLQTSTGLE
jgi:hypothetical protein